jgi:hypothetical protein
MAIQSGSAVSDYTLDISGVRKSVAEAKRLLADLRKEAAQPLPTPKVTPQTGGSDAAALKAALNQQRLATSQQRTALTANQAAVAAQRLATEQNKTAREASNATAAQDRAARSALNLATAQQRAANAAKNRGLGPALPRTFAGITSAGAGQLAGVAGGLFGLQAIIGAGSEALALRETQNGLQAVAGSTAKYANILKIARQQQELFGGTLRENINGLTGLAITSNQSGASLQTLVDLSQRLAVLDPAQGAAGARIALSEALSGDPTSLAKRYEIPRAALAKLRDETISASDKLAIIDQYLNKVGISSAAVAGRIDQDALAFRTAKADIEAASISLANYLTKVAAIPARGVSSLLQTGGVASSAVDAGTEVQAKLINQAQSYDAYAASVTNANSQLQSSIGGVAGWYGRLRLGLETLTPAQFAYAQSLIQSGYAQDVATQKAIGLTDVTEAYRVALQTATRGANEHGEAFTSLAPKMLEVSGLSDSNRQAVIALLGAYQAGAISVDQFKAVLAALESSHYAAAEAAAQEARENRALTRSFADVAPAADAAIGALDRFAGAQGKRRSIQDRSGNALSAAGVLGKGTGIDVQAVNRAYDEQLAAARLQFRLTTAKDNKAKIAILKGELAKTKDELKRQNIQNEIASLQSSGGSGGATTIKGLSAIDKSELSLIDDAQARLAEVNRRLAQGNLTQLQRNQLLIQQRNLQKEINQEARKQVEDQLSLQESIINNRKAERDERKQEKLFGRVAARGGERGQAAQDELDLININRQRRALAIQGLQEAVGTVVTPVGVTTPANVVSPTSGALTAPSGQAQATGQSGLTVNLNINGKTVATEIIPDILSALRGGIRGASNAGT